MVITRTMNKYMQTKEITSKVVKHGNSASVYVPKDWIGKNVKVTLIASMIALVLIMGPTLGNLAYAAKDSAGSSGGGGGGSTSSSGGGGGGDKGGSSSSGGGSDSGKSSSDKGGGSSSSMDKGSSSSSSSSSVSDKGGSSSGGGSVRIPVEPQQPNPHDDGFTKFDGPQPKNPQFSTDKIKHGPVFCSIGCSDKHDSDQICRGNICIPKIHDHFSHHHDHDNVEVIHKTVVVHDNNNTPQTLIINANNQGTCFVTQSQISNSKDILQTLLDQCVSITIVQG